MVTLKEQEAVDYLNRAQSCINPEDNFSNLQLVKTMLRIESAFIQRLSDKDPEMARVDIGTSGFPQFESWSVDIQNAFKQYDQIKSDRAKLLAAPFKQFLNVNPRGIIEECAKAVEKLADNSLFTGVFEGITEAQRNYLGREDTPLLQIDPKHPGLLFVRHQESPFQLEDFDPGAPVIVQNIYGIISKRIKLISQIPQKAGLKYFDAAEKPFMVYSIPEGIIRVLISGSPMLVRSGKVFKEAVEQDEHGHNKICRIRHDGERSYTDYIFYQVECPNINLLPNEPIGLEKKFAGINPDILNAVLNIETAGFQRPAVDRLINLLPDFDSLARDSFDFFRNSINGTIRNDVLLAQGQSYGKRIGEFFSSIDDDNLSIPLQLAFGQVLQPLGKELGWGIKVTEVDPRLYTPEMDMEPHKEILPKKKRRLLPWCSG